MSDMLARSLDDGDACCIDRKRKREESEWETCMAWWCTLDLKTFCVHVQLGTRGGDVFGFHRVLLGHVWKSYSYKMSCACARKEKSTNKEEKKRTAGVRSGPGTGLGAESTEGRVRLKFICSFFFSGLHKYREGLRRLHIKSIEAVRDRCL
jgi:hypothetical protein